MTEKEAEISAQAKMTATPKLDMPDISSVARGLTKALDEMTAPSFAVLDGAHF